MSENISVIMIINSQGVLSLDRYIHTEVYKTDLPQERCCKVTMLGHQMTGCNKENQIYCASLWLTIYYIYYILWLQ